MAISLTFKNEIVFLCLTAKLNGTNECRQVLHVTVVLTGRWCCLEMKP